MNEEPIRIKAIKTPDCYYLSFFSYTTQEGREDNAIRFYLFDGKKAEPAFKKNWVKVKDLPKKIQQISPIAPQLISFHLPDRFEANANLPRDVRADEIHKIDKFVVDIYERVYSEASEKLIDHEFSIDIIGSRETGWVMQTQKRPNVRYDTIDLLETHPDLLFERPHKLSNEESLNLLGEYLRTNVDPSVAIVEFDKNSKVKVKKFIELHEKKKVTVNIGTCKRPKYKERFYETEAVEVFSATCSEIWRGNYHWIVPFEGKNAEDLERNITNFLEDLVAKINTPQIVCECCKGFGVINKIIQQQKS